jgi:hypothetical protein
MNVDLVQGTVATVYNLVWFSRASDQRVPSSCFSFLIASRPLRPPLNHVHDLVVIVLVQSGSLAQVRRRPQRK